MLHLLNFLVLLWISSKVNSIGNYVSRSIYHDLQQLNASCINGTACPSQYFKDSNLECNCDVNCLYYDTCCFNSPYVEFGRPTIKSTCREVSRISTFPYYDFNFYHMIDRCPTSDSVWDSLCRDERNSTDDIIRIVPVISLSTYITYKNYFCFRCNEDNDGVYFWKVKFNSSDASNDISDEEKQHFSLNYDYEIRSWIVLFRNNSVRIPITLSLEIPAEISSLVKNCNPSVISTCSKNWTNSDVSGKCQRYMGARQVKRGSFYAVYKNLHCALCNFEDLKDISCLNELSFFPPTISGCCPDKQLFSFSHFLDVNRSDGDLVGKIRKCGNDNVWDPYANTCRRLTCAFPGHKIQNGRCVRG